MVSASRARAVLAKRSSGRILSRLAGSSREPFLEHPAELASRTSRTCRARPWRARASSSSTRRVRPPRMASTSRVLLQQLARDVQRQITGVDDALDEAQVQRQELLGVVHDEHAPHVQLQARARRRGATGRTARAPARTAGSCIRACPRRGCGSRPAGRSESWATCSVELAVFLVRDLGAGPRPQRLGLVDRLEVAASAASSLPRSLRIRTGKRDVVGVACGPARAAGSRRRTPSRPPSGAARRGCRARGSSTRLDAELAVRAGLPAHALGGRGPARRVRTSTRSATMKAE